MIRKNKNEQGQAIVLIVFAIVGLIGLTALTVDGGMAYSNRRHAQNAADTAALAAARAKIREEPWKGAALVIASENGFTDLFADETSSDEQINVEVYGCEEEIAWTACGDYATDENYLLVRITSVVNTTFSRVIGIQQVTNRVHAVARTKPLTNDPTMFGNAMISLMCGCKNENNWPKDPFTLTGNSTTVVGGSGVFVNSDCAGAFNATNPGSSLEAEDGGVCVVGSASTHSQYQGTPPNSFCGEPYPCPPPIVFPNKNACDLNKNGQVDSNERGDVVQVVGGPNPEYLASPGYISNFPKNGAPGKVVMPQGVYCLEGNVSLNAGWSLTSDSIENGMHDQYDEGVLIIVLDGKFDMNGASYLNLHAINDPSYDPQLQNLLIYLPPGNEEGLTINGSANSNLTGSIWAPSSHCSISGNSGSVGINSQIMCFTMSTAGDGQLNISYNQNENHIITVPPSVELTK